MKLLNFIKHYLFNNKKTKLVKLKFINNGEIVEFDYNQRDIIFDFSSQSQEYVMTIFQTDINILINVLNRKIFIDDNELLFQNNILYIKDNYKILKLIEIGNEKIIVYEQIIWNKISQYICKITELITSEYFNSLQYKSDYFNNKLNKNYLD